MKRKTLLFQQRQKFLQTMAQNLLLPFSLLIALLSLVGLHNVSATKTTVYSKTNRSVHGNREPSSTKAAIVSDISKLGKLSDEPIMLDDNVDKETPPTIGGIEPVKAPGKLDKVQELSMTAVTETPVLPPPPSVNGSQYPYSGAPFPNSMPDKWGMYQRQCVSYVAWKVAASGRHMPYWGGRGDAVNWDDNAIASGLIVSAVPIVGSVAVDNARNHVAYVEAVNPDGSIHISQYNGRGDGTYSEETRSPLGLRFIYFQ